MEHNYNIYHPLANRTCLGGQYYVSGPVGVGITGPRSRVGCSPLGTMFREVSINLPLDIPTHLAYLPIGHTHPGHTHPPASDTSLS